jgi:hypothetical protein
LKLREKRRSYTSYGGWRSMPARGRRSRQLWSCDPQKNKRTAPFSRDIDQIVDIGLGALSAYPVSFWRKVRLLLRQNVPGSPTRLCDNPIVAVVAFVAYVPVRPPSPGKAVNQFVALSPEFEFLASGHLPTIANEARS